MIWPIPNFMAWTALAVGRAVGAGVQQIRVNNAKTELAQVREQHAQAVADAALAKAAAHARALEIERELTAREQALPPADGALNTIAAMFHSGEEIEGPDGLAMMVDMALWNDALNAFEGIIGDEME